MPHTHVTVNIKAPTRDVNSKRTTDVWSEAARQAAARARAAHHKAAESHEAAAGAHREAASSSKGHTDRAHTAANMKTDTAHRATAASSKAEGEAYVAHRDPAQSVGSAGVHGDSKHMGHMGDATISSREASFHSQMSNGERTDKGYNKKGAAAQNATKAAEHHEAAAKHHRAMAAAIKE